MTFGERLKVARERKGLSQRQVARDAGIRAATISDLERGARPDLPLSVALKIARALGVGLDHLAGTWEEEEPHQARLPVVS
jgi:transcriptional regulator with XRE-family HTH domain